LPAVVPASATLHAAAATTALIWPTTWPAALAAVALNHVALVAAGLWPRSTLLGPNVRCLPHAAAARGEVALTLDDGPDPEVTPAVLDLLQAHGVRATFFCIGERVRRHPALTRRIVDAGHSVQNHSLRHRHHFSFLGPRGFEREIGDAQSLLADVTGVRPHCFRAPAGLRNPLLDPVLHRLNLHLVSWSRRAFDTRRSDPAAVLQRLSQGLGGGSIVLLHDGHSRRTAQGRAVVLEVLPAFLQTCRDNGLRPVTLSEALPARRTA
jgi:peptidoglycan/xylan/chitin deacetylase (PgdA/CDA1 family)